MNSLIRSEAVLPDRRRTFEAMIEEFLCSQDVRPSSCATYRREIRAFFSWLDVNKAETLTDEDILRFKRSLDERGLSSLTITNYLVAVRKFFAWTETKGYYPNVAKTIKGAKRTKGFRKDPLTPEQVKGLLAEIDRTTPEGKRDYALVNLFIRTGLRTIEVIRANAGDIRQQGGDALLYIQGKGRDGKDEFVLLTEATLRPIREYLASRKAVKDEEPLFVSLSNRNGGERLSTRSLRRIVKNRLRGIEIEDKRITAHSLRHTAITLSLLGGATIQEAQALARHADINTTLVYAHNINRVANAPERKIDSMLGD